MILSLVNSNGAMYLSVEMNLNYFGHSGHLDHLISDK